MGDRQYKYDVVLKEKGKDSAFLSVGIDEYHLDFIVHSFTGHTQLNLFCVVYDSEGKVSDSLECQAFTIPWDNILYIHQMHSVKTAFDNASQRVSKDMDLVTKITEEHKNRTKNDVAVG